MQTSAPTGSRDNFAHGYEVMAIDDHHRIRTSHPGSPDERVAGGARSWREAVVTQKPMPQFADRTLPNSTTDADGPQAKYAGSLHQTFVGCLRVAKPSSIPSTALLIFPQRKAWGSSA